MAKRTYLLPFLLLTLSGTAIEGCANATVVAQLTSALLSEYEREARPPPSVLPAFEDDHPAEDKATRIAIELGVRHARIDETTAAAIIVADVYMAWMDTRLMWNASDWGVEAAYVDADDVWRPDVTLLNAAETAESELPARVMLAATGAAMWVPRLHASAPCQLSLDDWPRDQHICGFEFGSRIYSNKEVRYYFHTYEKGEMKEREAGDWAASVVHSALVEVSREGGEYSAVRWLVSIRRRGDAHFVTARVIGAVVALLILCAMLVEAGARSTLHAAAATAAVLHVTAAVSRLPPAATAPRVLRLHAALLVMAAVSAVCAALVVRVARLSGRPPPGLRRLLLRTSFATGYREDQKESVSEPASPAAAAPASAPASTPTQSCSWKAASRALDMLFHLLISLVILILLVYYWWA